MDILDLVFAGSLVLWLLSLTITWIWVLLKLYPPEASFERGGRFGSRRWMSPWWRIRQKALLLTWGPLIVLVTLYWILRRAI